MSIGKAESQSCVPFKRLSHSVELCPSSDGTDLRSALLKKLSSSFVDSNFRRSFRELCPLSLSLSGEEELEEDESDELDDEGSEGGFFDFFLLL